MCIYVLTKSKATVDVGQTILIHDAKNRSMNRSKYKVFNKIDDSCIGPPKNTIFNTEGKFTLWIIYYKFYFTIYDLVQIDMVHWVRCG
jgi:hypothetical protein